MTDPYDIEIIYLNGFPSLPLDLNLNIEIGMLPSQETNETFINLYLKASLYPKQRLYKFSETNRVE